jgi:uncharacterized cupin superfamily protein
VPANIYDSEPDFARDGMSARVVGQNAGCELIGATVYDLEPGGRQADLHLHHANEELVVVLEGTPTLYTLEGSRELARGEVVACLRGRRGAHRLENHSEEPAGVLIVSTLLMPEVVEYPERDKGGGVFVMTEPPYTGAAYDESKGRVLRLFWRDDGLPIPPDEPSSE